MNGSASATERTLNCQASLVFPRARRSSKYSDRGNDIHGYMRATIAGVPSDAAIAAVAPEHAATCRGFAWPTLIGDLTEVRCEVAYALDVVARAARFLGVDVGRDYAQFNLGPNEIPGTLDIEGLRFDGVWVIRDLKSGYQDVTDAEDNGQGLFLAAVIHLITGAPEVVFEVMKLKPDGGIYTDSSATYSAFEIDSFLDALEEAIVDSRTARRVYLSGGTPDVTVGPWCRYCEAMEACPAYSRLARAMAIDTADLESRVDGLTLAEAGVAWRKAKQIEAMLDRVLASLKDRARQAPLPLDGGKVVTVVSYERKDFNRDAALEMLRSHGATDAEIDSLYRTSRVEQVREANDPGAPRLMKARKRAKELAP